MVNNWFKYLVVFSSNTVWSKTNLLHCWKNESIIMEALDLKYIEECGINDIGEYQYRITELGKKVRDN